MGFETYHVLHNTRSRIPCDAHDFEGMAMEMHRMCFSTGIEKERGAVRSSPFVVF
jgi:hypothetical protein